MKHAILLSMILLGCGGNGGSATGDDAANPDTGIDSPPIPEGYERLIGRTWSLTAGQHDIYKCVRFTVPEDMYITSIQAQAPAGTHHTVLSFAGANGTGGADGEQDCDVGTIGRVMIFASGVGTPPLDFPTDVGIKIAAGTQIHLNLHLFNATDAAMSGESAILIKRVTTPPPMLAEMVFAGAFIFSIPSNNQPTTKTFSCQAKHDFNIFAVWPHQHKIGTHNKVSVTRNGVETVMHDDAYDFNEQAYYLQTPEITVTPNDTINVACTWVNNTGGTITFGDSSNKEMCFDGLYRYPTQNVGIFECTDTGGAGF